MPVTPQPPPAVPDRPTGAGMYDFYLGGTENTPADQAAAKQVMAALPVIPDTAWANRGFLQRAVARMAAEWGVRQFLDIGAGLPTQRNTHDVVAEAVPDGRVLYVDADPLVVARGRALVADLPYTAVIEGDVRDPDGIFGHPEADRLLDLTAPLGLLLVAVLHFVPDQDDPWQLLARYVDALPSGSYLALSHGTGDHASEAEKQAVERVYAATPTPLADRTKSEVERFFAGLELVPPYPGAAPAVTFAGVWGADDPAEADSEGGRFVYAGVGRKR